MESMFASWPDTAFLREHQHRTLHGWLLEHCDGHLSEVPQKVE
jgi:hypothetical protein